VTADCQPYEGQQVEEARKQKNGSFKINMKVAIIYNSFFEKNNPEIH
jgi:hypothetical protein